MALILAGRVLPLAPDDPSAEFSGRVYLGDDGLVNAVLDGPAAAPPGFSTAPVVDVGDAIIMPGLIDMHNHLGYNALPLWTEPAQKKPFLHHNSWTTARTYKQAISWPAWVLANADPEALIAYVQTRALVGGTTSIQGWPASNREPLMVLRNVDDEKAGTTSRNLIYTSALTKKPLELAKTAQQMSRGIGFVYHCAEGQPGSVVAREFTDVANAGCLMKTLVAIHCNAVPDEEWERWSEADAGAVAWSPFSNLWLYGSTTNIPAVRARGVSVCLGSDWGPSGTKHVLAELKVAKTVSGMLGFELGDQELAAMVTANPGDVLSRCWSRPIGRLVHGGFGDVTVLRRRGEGDVWSQIVNATEKEVMLVVVGSKPRYGDSAVMTAAGASVAGTLTVAGRKRKLAIPHPTDAAKAWTWKDIAARLREVRNDPTAALQRRDALRRGFTGSPTSAEAPLELALDMPSGGTMAFAGPPPDPATVVIPPLPSLTHDRAFFKDIRGRGFHGRVLDKLAEFYVE